MTVEEGIADGVDQVRYAVRYQIKHGAQLIKICASGGVMSDSGSAGAQHYSDDELYAMDISKAPEAVKAKAAELFHRARTSVKAAADAGVKIADAAARAAGGDRQRRRAHRQGRPGPPRPRPAGRHHWGSREPAGTYSAFGDIYPLSEFPDLVAAVPKGLFLTGPPAVEFTGEDTAAGTQPQCFIDQATHDMRIGNYKDSYLHTAAGWRRRTGAMTFMRRSGEHNSGIPHAHKGAR
jgi:hypothetical protein